MAMQPKLKCPHAAPLHPGGRPRQHPPTLPTGRNWGVRRGQCLWIRHNSWAKRIWGRLSFQGWFLRRDLAHARVTVTEPALTPLHFWGDYNWNVYKLQHLRVVTLYMRGSWGCLQLHEFCDKGFVVTGRTGNTMLRAFVFASASLYTGTNPPCRIPAILHRTLLLLPGIPVAATSGAS